MTSDDLAQLRTWLENLDVECLGPVPEQPGDAQLHIERLRWQLICAMCGGWGSVTYIMSNLLGEQIHPRRWLDLCGGCNATLRRAVDKDTYEQALAWTIPGWGYTCQL